MIYEVRKSLVVSGIRPVAAVQDQDRAGLHSCSATRPVGWYTSQPGSTPPPAPSPANRSTVATPSVGTANSTSSPVATAARAQQRKKVIKPAPSMKQDAHRHSKVERIERMSKSDYRTLNRPRLSATHDLPEPRSRSSHRSRLRSDPIMHHRITAQAVHLLRFRRLIPTAYAFIDAPQPGEREAPSGTEFERMNQTQADKGSGGAKL